jgi:T4 beta protein
MFEVARYVPILHARAAEQKAYRELPAPTKDLIFPVFVARPWPNAHQLSTLWERLQEGVAGRRFGVDLDYTRRNKASDRPAQGQFDDLFNPADGFEAYYATIQEIDGSVPVLRSENGEFLDIEQQCARVQEIGRGGFFRIQRQRPASHAAFLNLLDNPIAQGIAVIVDLGWGRDLLLQEAWATEIIGTITNVDPDREIVVCGSSFPDSFQGVPDKADFSILERTAFGDIRGQLNANLFYGDWGSTRPPAVDSSAMRNIPRIDLSLSTLWRCFRSEKIDDEDPESERESYVDIAKRVVTDPAWPNAPKLWGTYAIETTAQDLPGAIRSPGSAAAARINVHLHLQAHHDTPELISQTDEPYTD